jgi:hypothetical protein
MGVGFKIRKRIHFLQIRTCNREKRWKEAVMVYFDVISWYWASKTEETRK